jgi:hypothetical protein
VVADDFVAFIFYGADGMLLGAAGVPPLVQLDAVTGGVGPGADGGVAGRGHCVGVVVVAIRKVGAALEEEIEAGGSLEVVAVAVQIVAAELVDDEDDDEFGGRVVGVCTGGRGGGDGKQGDERGGEGLTQKFRTHTPQGTWGMFQDVRICGRR